MRKYLVIMIFVLIFLPLASAVICQDRVEVDDMPCEAITPVISCGNFTANVTNLNDTSINLMVNMSAVGDGTYNFTFPFSNVSAYSIVLCDNSSGTLEVFIDGDKHLYFYGAGLLLALLLGGFATSREDILMMFFSGLTFTALGLTYFVVGYPGLDDNTLNLAITLILVGTGGYTMLNSALKYFGG